MKDKQFKALLEIFMVSDAWGENDANRDIVVDMLNNEARLRGYDDATIAYETLVPRAARQSKRKPRKKRGKTT